MQDKIEAFYAELSRQQVSDVERHCREIHAAAVGHSFVLLCTTPWRAMQAAWKKMVPVGPEEQPTLR